MSLPCVNFLHLTVSEIQPGQTFPRRPPTHLDTMGENNTPTALKGCGINNSKCNSFQVTTDLLKSENLKVAIAQLCNELQVYNFTVIAPPKVDE